VETGRRFGLPVLYFTQILGLALGLSFKDLALHKHIVPPLALVAGLRETAAAPKLLPVSAGA
jgi:heterodisulfide reductase subunit B